MELKIFFFFSKDWLFIFLYIFSPSFVFRVWDCERLHTIVTNRSRLTCKIQKGQISSVATVRNTHCVASAANVEQTNSGSVHIFNVEHHRRVEKSFFKTIYTGIQTVRVIDRSEGRIFDVRNFEPSQASSMLIFATSNGNIHGLDLRLKANEESFVLRNSPRLGFSTSISVDNSSNWIMVGSDLGVYTIWDIRFQIPVRSFRHPCCRTPVHPCAASARPPVPRR